jgi:uncharacterized protein (DUF2235 family)
MGKRIVFCCDGTWEGPQGYSNVYRIYKAFTVSSDQVTFYDDGIGADATGLDRLIQGAFGESILQKIRDAYTKIAHVYEPGDDIFLFGFSRGAYTARSLAGFIAVCGLPCGNFSDDCITTAFAAYRDPVHRTSLLGGLGSCGLVKASIKMVGVWDTVGSLGIPAIFGGIDEKVYGFLDTDLHPDVQNAYHALAIDEQRAQFPATLWTSAPAPGQTMQQVWFTGCHGDVGGGIPSSGSVDSGTLLSDITFSWMLGKAQGAGLSVDPAMVPKCACLPAQCALDAIHESWKPVSGPPHLRPIPPNATIANSVGVRIRYALSYTPGNLQLQDRQLAAGYSSVPVVNEDPF